LNLGLMVGAHTVGNSALVSIGIGRARVPCQEAWPTLPHDCPSLGVQYHLSILADLFQAVCVSLPLQLLDERRVNTPEILAGLSLADALEELPQVGANLTRLHASS